MSKKIGKDNDLFGEDFPTGPIRYTLRNDYMFKAVLQKNKRALTGLLAALLYLPAEEIVDTIIMNPIELGETVDDKTCILDIKIKLNDNKIINIELRGLYKRIGELGYNLEVSDTAKEFVATKGYDVQFGARPLKRAIQSYIEDGVCERILSGEIKFGDTIKVDKPAGSDKLTFE